MSRHKLVKTIDLDDELDDYDGADFEEDFQADECKTLRILITVCADQSLSSDS